jgi:hypothetical protein
MEGMPSKVRVDTLFALARGAAREAELDQARAKTMAAVVAGRRGVEDQSRERELAKMRDVTRSQLGLALASRGVAMPPVLLPGSDPSAAHISAAAAQGTR